MAPQGCSVNSNFYSRNARAAMNTMVIIKGPG